MKQGKEKSLFLTRIIPNAEEKRKYMLFFGNAFSFAFCFYTWMPMWYIHNIIKM